MYCTKKVKLSIVVPVYNEQDRVQNIYRLFSFLNKKPYFYELIVVDDGSIDKTKQAVREIQKKIPIRLVSYIKNRGKGFAIRKGAKTAKGTHILFLDVDLSTSLTALDTIVSTAAKKDVVVGTRKGKGSSIITHQPFLRETLGKVFTWFSQVITGMTVSDFTCGCKCFSRRAIQRIISKQTIYRWSFDTEFLLIAQKAGFSIQEIPIQWKNDKNTKVRFPQDIFVSLQELLLIWVQSVLGKYG